MTFPKWDRDVFRTESYFKNQGCQIVDRSPNINSGATCVFTRNQNDDQIMIESAFLPSETIQSGETINFVVEEVRNSPSTRGTSNVNIYTLQDGKNIIDQALK